jgi:hypothetical protein
MRTRLALSLTVALAIAGSARESSACAVCGAGDPTLTLMGSERAFQGRARAAADLRVGSARLRSNGVDYEVDEARLDLAAAYAPTPTLLLSLSAPLLYRSILGRDGSTKAAVLGDLELRARAFVWDKKLGPFRHQFAAHAGVKLPTAPDQSDASGASLPPDLQPGSGAISPLVGVFYSVRRDVVSFATSATLYLPFAVREGPHASDSFRTTAWLQVQARPFLATRLGFNTRTDSTAEDKDGLAPSSGGFVGYVASELVVSPKTDLLLTVGAHFPAVQVLRGTHREGTVASLGVTLDL